MTTMAGAVLFHAAVSILAIASGLLVIAGHIRGVARPKGTRTFLASAIATSATGLILPPGAIGGTFTAAWVGLAVLGLMIVALLVVRERGWSRAIYRIGLVFSVFLLVFAGVAQAFLKIPALQAMAPALNEPPFIVAEVVVVVLFAVLGILAVRAGPGRT